MDGKCVVFLTTPSDSRTSSTSRLIATFLLVPYHIEPIGTRELLCLDSDPTAISIVVSQGFEKPVEDGHVLYVPARMVVTPRLADTYWVVERVAHRGGCRTVVIIQNVARALRLAQTAHRLGFVVYDRACMFRCLYVARTIYIPPRGAALLVKE